MENNNQASPYVTLIIFVIIVIAIAVGGFLLYQSRPEPTEIIINPPLPTATQAPTPTREPITVYITGEVNEPQSTITLAFGSRVEDVIELAGGFTENANLELVNLAGIVRDGDQIHVPSLIEEEDEIIVATPSGGEVVYINSATAEELQTLPGIGESTAQAIIDYREENGAFASLEDLDNVPGIGPSTLENIAALISFD